MFGTLGPTELLILLSFLFFLTAPGGVLVVVAIATSGKRYPESFIDRQNPDGRFTTATPARRLAGSLLDGLIAVLTLYIGWLIWLAIVAPRGQSPGKALVGTYILRADGTIASAGYVWLRDFGVKGLALGIISLILGIISLITGGAGGLLQVIGGMWCLWDKDKQCLWDKVVSTYVAYAPTNPAPLAQVQTTDIAGELTKLKQLLDGNILTPEEYEERRIRLVARL